MKHRRVAEQEQQPEATSQPGHYATKEEAFIPGTRKLKPGFYWGRGADKGHILRSKVDKLIA